MAVIEQERLEILDDEFGAEIVTNLEIIHEGKQKKVNAFEYALSSKHSATDLWEDTNENI